jgi:uncharacterized protein
MIRKENFNIPGAKGRGMLADITFDTDNKNAPVVIFAHGFKGFKDWGAHDMVARYFAKNGFRYIKFNFSHNGTTADCPTEFADLIAFGQNTFSIELEDLNHVINFAVDGPVMPAVDSVYLIGHSLGGGISIVQAAEDKRVAKLVTMASVSGFNHLWPQEVEEQWKLQGVLYIPNFRTGQEMPLKYTLLKDLQKNSTRLDIPARAAEIKQPWLIVHGSEDKTVAFESAQKLGKSNSNAVLTIIPTADHTFGATHPYDKKTLPKPLHEFCDEVIEFFKR